MTNPPPSNELPPLFFVFDLIEFNQIKSWFDLIQIKSDLIWLKCWFDLIWLGFSGGVDLIWLELIWFDWNVDLIWFDSFFGGAWFDLIWLKGLDLIQINQIKNLTIIKKSNQNLNSTWSNNIWTRLEASKYLCVYTRFIEASARPRPKHTISWQNVCRAKSRYQIDPYLVSQVREFKTPWVDANVFQLVTMQFDFFWFDWIQSNQIMIWFDWNGDLIWFDWFFWGWWFDLIWFDWKGLIWFKSIKSKLW